MKSDALNEDKILVLITDNYGYLHVFDVTKHQKVSKTKIHDSEIIQSKVSAKKNFIYTLDQSGIIKFTNFSNYSNIITEKKFNLQTSSKTKTNKHSQINQKISFFDMDRKEKNLVFNKGLKIKIVNLDNMSTRTIGTHSSQISQVTFSNDSKFVLSSTEKDYFVYLWDWKSNTNKAPTVSLQLNSLTNKTIIRKVENSADIYHAFSFNNEYVYGHLINLEDINKNKSSNAPLLRNFQLHAPEKNLINLEFDLAEDEFISDRNTSLNLIAVYGNTFVTSNVAVRKIKYANNFKNFVSNEVILPAVRSEANLVNSKLEKGKVIVNKNFAVLNEIEMNENNRNEGTHHSEVEDLTHTNDNEYQLENITSFSTLDEKISLINLIKNSIINNDISTLEWTLDQKDHSIIDTTVRKMNKHLIKLFISKLIEIFQSNLIVKSKTNFLKWIELLFKYHTIVILKMPVDVLNTLRRINSIINSRIKNLDRLVEINKKFEGIMKEINLNQNSQNKKGNQFVTYEPLLIYNESDSEEEIRKKGIIEEEAKKRGLTLTKEKEYVRRKKEFEEDADDVDMFVDEKAFEDDLMMEDLDQMDQDDKNENEKEEDDIDEEDEDFEDDD